MDQNPYTPPSTNAPENIVNDTSNEEIRRQYLSTEASIKSVGLLYYIAVFFGIGGAIAMLNSGKMVVLSPETLGTLFGRLLFLTIFALLGFYISRLDRLARVIATIPTVIGLFVFPFGTIICGYILYLFFGKKGQVVFSREYKKVIEITPHIRYKGSKLIWITFILFIVFVLSMIFLGSLS